VSALVVTESPVAPRLRRAASRLTLREVQLQYTAAIGLHTGDVVTQPGPVAAALAAHYGTETDPQENLLLLTLDNKSRILSTFRLFRGTINGCETSAREIITAALLDGASQILLAHNHPSGDPAPSPQDIAFTKKVREACDLFSVTLVDHIILGSPHHRYVSLKERGHL
jgi:DNA repair protein RadC